MDENTEKKKSPKLEEKDCLTRKSSSIKFSEQTKTNIKHFNHHNFGKFASTF